ncbi:MAG: hypothetical protein KF833_07305 [Verrucomicrobiae bacterium]|nr:hypothetical protein [Verrucomicrobiae bacterium]
METPTLRQRLALRLEGYPLLRMLVLDRAFFWAFLVVTGGIAGLALALPKVWRTTPRDFPRGTVKISLLDLGQAWSLGRAARRAEARGDHDGAMLAWRGALVNNLGDPDRHRDLLVHLREVPEARPDHVTAALFSSTWLLALTGTNVSDLELAADVLEKYRVAGYGLDLLEASKLEAEAKLAAVRARCLFSVGRVEAFLALWEANATAWGADARQRLYHDAWRAGWDTGTPAVEALLRLKEATREGGNLGLTAARMVLTAGTRRGTPDDVALALDRLEEGRAASVTQHAMYWRFLASVGDLEKAREKARSYEGTPRLPTDAAEYAAVLAALGFRDEAIRFLEGNLGRLGTHPSVWEVYLSILIDARRWNDVRRAANQVRTQTASFEMARILAEFAEYRAESGDGRDHMADTLARRLGQVPILDGGMAMRIADTLLRDGRAEPALGLLRRKRTEMAGMLPYWQLVFAAALSARDLEGMQESTLEMLRLAPNSPVALSNRAAMLIALEEKSPEALEITFRLVTQYPNAAAFQINHAFALLLNQRVNEAWEILRRLDPGRLDRQAASAFHLAVTEARYARGEYAEALEASDRVQPGLILPPQARRLERLRQELRTRVRG